MPPGEPNAATPEQLERRRALVSLFARSAAAQAAERDDAAPPPPAPSHVVHCELAESRWWVRSDWVERLIGPEGLRLAEWIEAGRTQIVKHGPHRTVYRVELGPAAIYVKHYRSPGAIDLVRRLFQASPSRREWDKTLAMAERGISTIWPLACGEELAWGQARDNYFVSLAIPNSEPLDEFLRERLPQEPRHVQTATLRKLTTALAELCANCHERGVDHDDFHAGNILIQRQSRLHAADPEVRLYLIDTPGVRLRSRLDWRASCQSLAMLNTSMRELTSRIRRWRFWYEYLARRPQLAAPSQAILSIDAETWQHAQRIFHSRDKRALRNNQDFFRLRLAAGNGHAITDLLPSELAALVEAAPKSGLPALPAAAQATSPWYPATIAAGGAAQPVVVRRYALSAAALSTWPVRRAPWHRDWLVAHALLARGIATPRPWCVIERRLPHDRAAYLAIERRTDAIPLAEFLRRLPLLARRSQLARGRQLAGALAQLFAQMHRWGVQHGRLAADSILIAVQPKGLAALVTDLDAVRLGWRFARKAAQHDLRQFYASLRSQRHLRPTFVCRFLKRYLAALGLPTSDWKAWWRAIR